jgi:hypothetical protein
MSEEDRQRGGEGEEIAYEQARRLIQKQKLISKFTLNDADITARMSQVGMPVSALLGRAGGLGGSSSDRDFGPGADPTLRWDFDPTDPLRQTDVDPIDSWQRPVP